ncbi:sensor histidine kinase [Chlorogloea sp. CCALA 695]|uniref:sensor histidine kinase n=1 Tax=Chlorogloea sp. CCALA 695 TaxID=2107693 RepID=UPI000D07C605|nr:HAMP domain-containing sensor histidine kinase [Chlorogloea sp. CCALA 695]PSB34548.1 sensor histidine kinase [Chlorogloea sp. CCALA 695]
MNDFSQLLSDKINVITDNWVTAVRQDRQIESADNLSRTAIQDHIPLLLEAMVTVIFRSQESEIQPILEASWEHGGLRATQGFDPTEIVREYCLLRQVIFSTLETELLQAKPIELFRVLRLIDATVDEAISQCFKSYVHERLRELEQLHSQLQLNNQELTRLVRANQDKFSHLAHELKNPLTSIIGYSDLFLRQERKSSQVKDNFTNIEHIERVLRNGRHLLHLVNDALDVSRYQEGKMKLQVAPTSVRFLVNSVVEMLEPSVREKQLEIIVDCDRAPDEIRTDSLRLQQIITNLVSNALRYTHQGKVKLICERQDSDKWALIVSDTGIGISAENKELIFNPYYRVSNEEKAYLPESTGLGLAIVDQLVQLLKGKIELVSQVGVGSTFTVTFPLAI